MLDLKVGAKFGDHYEILRPISAGGMAAVYLARDLEHPERAVAIKVLFLGAMKAKEARERFKNELILSSRLQHPNIVRAFDYYEDAEVQAFVMEYVDGGDLSERMNGNPMSPDRVTSIMRQVASGLEAVHSQGVVHRDLKPENILLGAGGSVKISDFGLARLRGGTTLTQAGAMVGTAKYLSPEYAETGECDHRSDIYALGVIGYELISGVSPVGADLKLSTILERLRGPLPPVSEVAPSCPAELALIIDRAMQFHVAERYQSSAELRSDLERYEASIHAPKSVAPRLITPSRAVIAILSIVLVMLVAVKGLMLNRVDSELNSLPKGLYQGEARNLLTRGMHEPFLIWRTEIGTYVLLGREGCSVVPLDRDNRFSCGKFNFTLMADRVTPQSSRGEITDDDWDLRGDWKITGDLR